MRIPCGGVPPFARGRPGRPIILLFVACVGSASLRAAPEDAGRARFHVSSTMVDLGRLAPGDDRPFSLQIENRGTDVLVVHSVRANCRCMSPAKQWRDVSLLPGESRQVEFHLAAEPDAGGRQTNTILFATNDPQQKYARVFVSYAVKPQYRFRTLPAKLDYGEIPPATARVLPVTLVSPYPEKPKVDALLSSHPSIVVRPTPSDGRRDVLSYTVRVAEDFPPGPVREEIVIQISDTKLTIPVVAYKMAALECTPRSIVFPSAGPAEDSLAEVVLRSTTGGAFRVVQTQAESAALRVEAGTGTEPGTTHLLRIRLTPYAKHPGASRSRIRIVTDTLGSKTLDCFYFVRP